MIIVKRGETLRKVAIVRDVVTQQPIDLTGQTITCYVRQPNGKLVVMTTVTILDQSVDTGKVLIDFGNTIDWPIQTLNFDVRRVYQDGTFTTVQIDKTQTIKVERSITYDQ